jgi:hypothetical protein
MELISQVDVPPWAAVLSVVAYYALLSTFFRWRPKRAVIVTRYKPPDEISPAVATCLIEDGRIERAFAVALVSLATKGYIEIQQQDSNYILSKLRDSTAELPPEESEILDAVFADRETYAFNATDCDRLCEAYRKFENIVNGLTSPDLISAHLLLWAIGIACSIAICVQLVLQQPEIASNLSAWSIGYIGLWTVLGASCLISAVRIWPDTIEKISSWLILRGSRRRPITLNDAAPGFLTAIAGGGFALLGASTSAQFAALVAALVLTSAVARRTLEAPTAYGRRVIEQLKGFQEYLQRADADRLTRENFAGVAPEILEQYSAYAVAFDIDRGWGRNFASEMTEFIEYQRGTEFWTDFAVSSNDRIALSFRAKK